MLKQAFACKLRRVRARRAQAGNAVPVQALKRVYHASSARSPVVTALRAAMATSICPSSGSLVVSFCSSMPGALTARVNQLSYRPMSLSAS